MSRQLLGKPDSFCAPCCGASFEFWSPRRKKQLIGSGQIEPGFQVDVVSITSDSNSARAQHHWERLRKCVFPTDE